MPSTGIHTQVSRAATALVNTRLHVDDLIFTVVYPGVDFLAEDGSVTTSGNAVASFSWALKHTWEVRLQCNHVEVG